MNTSAQIDASGRQRVSQMNTLLDIKLFKDSQPLLVDRVNIGSATQVHDGTDGVDLNVTANNGDAAIGQSFQRASYFSGKSQLGEITWSNGQWQSGTIKRIGYFTSNTASPYNSNKDGLWFEADGDAEEYYLVISKNGTEKLRVKQSDWNIQNKTPWFKPGNFTVFVFQFLYLGGTAIRFGFVHEGAIKWVHQYNHANAVAGTFVKSPQQPIRYEIRSTGGAGSLKQVCSQVASEGSVGEAGIPSHLDNIGQSLATAGTDYAVLGFQLNSNYQDIVIRQERLILNATTNDDFEWHFCLNPTFSSSPTFTQLTNTAIDTYTGAVTITDFGYIMDGGSIQGNTTQAFDLASKLKPGASIDGVSDRFVLVITPKTNNMTLDASLTLTELR